MHSEPRLRRSRHSSRMAHCSNNGWLGTFLPLSMCCGRIVGLNGLGFNLDGVPSNVFVYRGRIGTGGPKANARSGTQSRLFLRWKRLCSSAVTPVPPRRESTLIISATVGVAGATIPAELGDDADLSFSTECEM